jgi:hypothetical protein
VYLLRLSEPDDLARVCEFLRRVHVDAQARADGTVSVAIPGAASPLHERREITGYLTTWNALNPGSSLELFEEPSELT